MNTIWVLTLRVDFDAASCDEDGVGDPKFGNNVIACLLGWFYFGYALPFAPTRLNGCIVLPQLGVPRGLARTDAVPCKRCRALYAWPC